MLHYGSRQLLWDFPFLVNATFLKRKPIGLSQIGRQGSRKELSKSYPFSEWYNALRSLNAERKAVLGGAVLKCRLTSLKNLPDYVELCQRRVSVQRITVYKG